MTRTPTTTNWGSKDWAGADAAALERKELAEDFAWTTLASLTAGALATSPMSVRPARATCSPRTFYVAPVDGAGGPFHPYVGEDGLWRNAVHQAGCSCDHSARSVPLPGDATEVLSVEIDGVAVPRSEWHFADGQLVRRAGYWPLRQDAYAAAGEVGSFVVTYWAGVAPDRKANWAAGVLAREYLTLMETGDTKGCRLSKRVKAVTRQGVTFDLALTPFQPGESTTILEVDAFVASLNPHRLVAPSRVFSVDMPTPRFTGHRAAAVSPTAGLVLTPDPDRPGYYRLRG